MILTHTQTHDFRLHNVDFMHVVRTATRTMYRLIRHLIQYLELALNDRVVVQPV